MLWTTACFTSLPSVFSLSPRTIPILPRRPSNDAFCGVRREGFRVTVACSPTPRPSKTKREADPAALQSPFESPVRIFFRERVLSGFEPTPELAAILTVYFVQGALGISRLALSFFLKDELHLGPAEIASLTAIFTAPWIIKPVYGILSDSLPLFGYRRRSYLLGAGVLGAIGWFALATGSHSVTSVTIAALATSASVAISDVIADSLVVERVRDKPAAMSGALQALCWSSSALGGLLSAYLSGSLLEVFTARQIFAGTAMLPLLTATLTVLVAEEPVSLSGVKEFAGILRARSIALWAALSNRSVFLPTLFVFLWQATPNPDSAMFFFNTSVLGFGPEFLGRVRLAAAGASLLGLWAYQRVFRHMEIKTIFIGATLAGLPLALTQLVLVTRLNVPLGISDKLFALADTAVLAALGQIAFMPTLVLAARLCPPGVEGTLFAALMSVYNGSGATSNELGSLLTDKLGVTESDYSNLPLLITICAFSSLIPLPLLGLIDEAPPPAEETDDTGGNERASLQSAETRSLKTMPPADVVGDGDILLREGSRDAAQER